MKAAKKSLVGLWLLALPFVLFWQVWWPDNEHQRVFQRGDFVEQIYPFRVFVARELGSGRLPTWDSHTFSGYPAIAESQHATFYPLSMWQFLFEEPIPFLALEIEALLHLGLAGIFTFLLVRQLTGRSDAGMLAGSTFSLSGFLTSYPVLQLTILEAAVWLPASLWLLELAIHRLSLRLAALAGVALGCSICAGHPQTSMYIGLLISGYSLTSIITRTGTRRFVLVATLLASIIGLGLSAAQWMPSIQLAALSPRSNLSYDQLSGGFGTSALLGLFRPNPEEWSPLYVGFVPLTLACVGLLINRAETRFWALVASVALLLSLGRHGFLYPLLYAIEPRAAVFRGQERAAFLVSFALIVLASYGYSFLSQKKWWPSWMIPILLTLTWIDLFRANHGIVLQQPPSNGFFSQTPAASFLIQNKNISRVSSEGLLPGGGNAGKFFQLKDVTGNGPLSLEHYHKFLEQVPEVRWWQLLNVEFVLTRRIIDFPGVLLVMEDKQRNENVYQIDLGGQPAWITHAFELTPSQEAAFQMTADMNGLDPMTTAVLEIQPNPTPEPANGPESIRILTAENQHIEAEITLSTAAVVVFSEVDYPGWKASVNGKPIDSVRAFGLLRALALPAGEWNVHWNYRPAPVLSGLALSGSTICLLILLLVCNPKYTTVHGQQQKPN